MAKSDSNPVNIGGDTMQPWEQLAGMNLNYPASIVQQPSYSGQMTPLSPYTMNSYGSFNLPTSLTGMNYSPQVNPGRASATNFSSMGPSSSVLSTYLQNMAPQLSTGGSNK